MDGVLSSIPTGGNFIFCSNIFKPLNVEKCQKSQICVKNENLDLWEYLYKKQVSRTYLHKYLVMFQIFDTFQSTIWNFLQ